LRNNPRSDFICSELRKYPKCRDIPAAVADFSSF
jgi:hypothetical protein